MDNQQKVIDFLNKQGFQFEMLVAQSFRKAGFHVLQSVNYRDPLTDKDREIDIVASTSRVYKGNAFTVTIPIECKYAPEPWIVFGDHTEAFRHMQESNHYITSNAYDWANQAILARRFKPFYINKEPVYGVAVVKKKQDGIEQSYVATQTLLNYMEHKNSILQSNPLNYLNKEIYIPMIVIKGELFVASLDHGIINAYPVQEAQLIWKHSNQEVFPKINILTAEIVDSMAIEFSEGAKSMLADEVLEQCILKAPGEKVMY